MCNCFLGNAENFIFDPKCKPSDTPDCDWHVTPVSETSLLPLTTERFVPVDKMACLC